MKAEDTVMSTNEILFMTGLFNVSRSLEKVTEAQAEISFKAGIREVVEDLLKVLDEAPRGHVIAALGVRLGEWQAKLKEWGIKEERWTIQLKNFGAMRMCSVA